MANLSDLLGGAVSTLSELSDCTESSSDPATDTNPSATGHLWVNTTSGEVYVCTDATSGSNVWTNVGDGADAVAPIVWYGDRGVFSGGYNNYPATNHKSMDYVTISTTSNATDFGDMAVLTQDHAGCSSGERGLFGGGRAAASGFASLNTIEYFAFSTTGNTTDFGDLSSARQYLTACSDGITGIFGGGYNSVNILEYVTIASTGNTTDFGDLSVARQYLASCSDGSRGVFGGGATVNTIDYVVMATTGNATDFGNLTDARGQLASCSDTTRGLFGGGTSVTVDTIDYITIATTSNATDFGNLSAVVRSLGACSNATRGLFGGGHAGGASKTIDHVTISSTGNSTDFGDLIENRWMVAACSGD